MTRNLLVGDPHSEGFVAQRDDALGRLNGARAMFVGFVTVNAIPDPLGFLDNL
jgi:hypothetical protein